MTGHYLSSCLGADRVAPSPHARGPRALVLRLAARTEGGAGHAADRGADDQAGARRARVHDEGKSIDGPAERGARRAPEEDLLEEIAERRIGRAVVGLVAGLGLAVLHVPFLVRGAL